METILLAVTVVSLLVALIMSAAAWRMSREERARSAARVAALAAAAADGPSSIQPVERESRPLEPHVEPRAPWAVSSASSAARSAASPNRLAVSEVERLAVAQIARVPDLVLNTSPLADELPLRPNVRTIEPSESASPDPSTLRQGQGRPEQSRGATGSGSPRATSRGEQAPASRGAPERATASRGVGESFLGTSVDRQSGGRQRGLAAAAVVLFVLLGGGAYWLLSDDSAAAASVAASASSPLELISLRHERQGPRLLVSGLVRNPGAGAPIDELTAVVLLFDQHGVFITSAKAGVDFRRLAPGDESPFVITFEAPSSVARYRVSFRTDAGVVAHVDRRGQAPVATAFKEP